MLLPFLCPASAPIASDHVAPQPVKACGPVCQQFRARRIGPAQAPSHAEEGQPEWVDRAQFLRDTDFGAYLTGMFTFFEALALVE